MAWIWHTCRPNPGQKRLMGQKIGLCYSNLFPGKPKMASKTLVSHPINKLSLLLTTFWPTKLSYKVRY